MGKTWLAVCRSSAMRLCAGLLIVCGTQTQLLAGTNTKMWSWEYTGIVGRVLEWRLDVFRFYQVYTYSTVSYSTDPYRPMDATFCSGIEYMGYMNVGFAGNYMGHEQNFTPATVGIPVVAYTGQSSYWGAYVGTIWWSDSAIRL